MQSQEAEIPVSIFLYLELPALLFTSDNGLPFRSGQPSCLPERHGAYSQEVVTHSIQKIPCRTPYVCHFFGFSPKHIDYHTPFVDNKSCCLRVDVGACGGGVHPSGSLGNLGPALSSSAPM